MKSSNILGIASLIIAGALVTSCQDDNIVKTIPIAVGDEISFSASASFEKGSLNDKTRTEYGNISQDGNSVALNWVKGDKVEIVCPQDHSGSKQAVYVIADGIDGGIDEGYEDEETDGNSYTSMLKKESESNLVWGEGYTGTLNGVETKGLHDFYALYPSRSSFSESVNEGNISIEIEGTGPDAVVKVTGTMPVAQNPIQQLTKIEAADGVPAHYIVQPDMRYAYMVAKKTTVSRYRPEDETEAPIQLKFTPLVTALQFDITGGLVDMDAHPEVKEVTIMQISLSSASGKSICGNFTYNYSTGECITSNTGTEGFNRITMDLTQNGVGGATLAKDEFCDVTFFLLPTAELKAGDLKLTIIYEVNGNVQYKVATIGRDLTATKKYYFKDLVLPPIEQNISGSSWFGALDNPIYMQQISFAIAGSAFSYMSSDTGSENGEASISYTRQQVKDYKTLWNMGVRGFEFVTQSTGDNYYQDIGDLQFVCGEEVLPYSETFEEAFDYLAEFIANNDKYPDYSNECLILICRYHAVDDLYNPARYVENVLDFLERKVSDNDYGLTADHFVNFSQEGLTVGDVKGKICIIIRPGDDDYTRWLYNDGKINIAKTSDIQLTGSMADKILLIQNWGSAFDRWDLRYSGNFAAEATWNNAIGGGKDNFEDYLFAIATSRTTPPSESSFKANRPEPAENFSLRRTATGTSLTPMIQEWQRVIPTQLGDQIICTYNSENDENVNDNNYLWVRWPESYTERTKAIDYTFRQSVAEKGTVSSNMFINTLSGYYATKRHMNSLEPFMKDFYSNGGTTTTTIGPASYNTEPDDLQFNGTTKYYINISTTRNHYLGGDTEGDSKMYGGKGDYNGNEYVWTLTGTTDGFTMQNGAGLYLAYNGSANDINSGDYYYLTPNESEAVTLVYEESSYNTYGLHRKGVKNRWMNPRDTGGHPLMEWTTLDENSIVYFYKQVSTTETSGAITITPFGQGSGGNFAELAVDMNTYVYNKLVNNEYGVGPYGLVVMDYIGASAEEFATHGGQEYSTAEEREAAATASTALIRLIYMNNFAFELQRKETTGGDDGKGEGGEDKPTTQDASVSFSNDPANPSGEIY